MSRNSQQPTFEGDLKVLKRSKLSRNHEYNALVQAVEKFNRELRLSSLQCKDRSQLSQQWEDQQFFRILVRMMHEVTTTTGMKQKEDLKKVYQWYQTNKSVLHSQPHFKGASSKEIYKRPVLKFAPDALKYYSTPSEKRKHKKVAFQGDGKARKRQQASYKEDEHLLEEVGSVSEDGTRGGQRPVTAPAGLHRPKVSNSLPRNIPSSCRPGSGYDDAGFTAGFVSDHVSPSSPDILMMQRPSSALGIMKQSQANDLESTSGDQAVSDTHEGSQLTSAPSMQSLTSVSVHLPNQDTPPDSARSNSDGQSHLQYSHSELDSRSQSSMMSRDGEPDMTAILKYKHPISSLVNPVARIQFDEELYDGGLSPDRRSRSPIKLQMHIDVPTDNSRSSRPMTAEEEKADNLQKWKDFQERQQYGQDVAAKQSFYGHGGLPTNVRYASHDGGEMPEFYTQDVISSYAEEDRTNSPWMYQQSGNAITSPSLEQFYEITERHSPQPRPSSRTGRQSDANRKSPVRGYIPDEVAAVMRSSNSPGANKEKTVKFEAVVDLANQVGDQLALQKEKLTPEPRHGYRQPTLKVARPRPQSAKMASPTSPPDRGSGPLPISPSGMSLADPSKVLFAPPNSSRQSTCSSGDFTPRTKRGDPIILLPETSQYTVHFRKNDRHVIDPYIPYAISRQGRVVPDQQRYKWRDDGFGNPTYYQVRSRASSAPGNRNMRSAGSTSAGYRPRTATEPSTKHEWSKPKTGDPSKQRVAQAASHSTVSIGPQSLASMMMIQHLGNDTRRERTRMGVPGYYLEEEFEASPPSMEYMSFTGPAKLTTRGQGDKALSIPTDESHLSDTTALNPPSQTSQLESLPSQEWYKQGSSGGVTEGQDIPCSSQGYADSLNAGSERTDDQSLSQDLGDIDDMLSDSHNSQDLGSEMQSFGSDSGNFDHGNVSDHLDNEDASNPSDTNNASDPQHQPDIEGAHPDHQDVNLAQNDETLPADIKGDFVGEFAERGNQNGISEDGAADDDQSVNSQSVDREDERSNVENGTSSGDLIEEDAPSEKSSDAEFITDIPSEHSLNVDMADESNESHTTHEVHFQDKINGHQEGNCDEEIRQAPDQILNRHFLAVTRDSVDRPKSANPRLVGQGKEGRNHYGGKGRPASAEVGVRSVFTIEIDGSRGNPSSRSIQTVPIAYMSLTNDHRNQLQQRTLPLVDQRRPHFRGAPSMSPAITKKTLTPRDTPRNSPTVSPRGSDNGGSPAPSRDMSPAGTRENSVYSATGSRSDSPMTIVLQANLDHLQETGSLEATMPNLMQMSRSSLWSEGPPEPPASVDDGWSDINEATYRAASPMYQLAPPEIQIQRPSSAPTSRSTSSLSPASSSRPSSARVDGRLGSYTEKSPRVGMNFSRPRTVSTSHGREWKGRPLPMFGAAKDVEWEAKANQRAQEAKTSVNIRELFGGSAAKEYRKELERQERERWGKQQRDSRSMSRFYKDHLVRKEIALIQREDIFSRDWERNYLSDKMLKDRMRQDKWSELMRQQALDNRKALSMLKRIGPSVDIWELFHGGKRGVTKAQMKKAAITIQKFVRGWVVRSMLEKVKQKSRVHAGSFKGFVKYYSQLMKKIARWHGVKKPMIHLDLWQMDAFMDRKRYYEYVFAKRAQPGDSITIKDLDGFFKECDHFPSKREIFNAITGATKKDGKKLDSKLTEKEVIEITFMIYVPQGSNLRLEDTRKSTWLNPLVDGKEARKLMGSDSVEKAEYAKSLQVVFAAFQERQEKEVAIKKLEQKKKEEEVAAGGAANDKKK